MDMNEGLKQSDPAYMPSQAEEEWIQEIEEAGHNLGAIAAYRDNMGEKYTKLSEWQDWIGNFEDSYQGEMSTKEFAEQLADDCYLGGRDVPQWLISYFDYEKFERDLFMGDYWENDGFIFRSL
jgi:antirestriction protein